MKKLFIFFAVLVSLSVSAQNKIIIRGSGLSVGDTVTMLLPYKNKVDTVYRTPGKDSIQYTINGRYHAIKDSTISTNQTIGTIGAFVTGNGTIPTTGSIGFITIPYNCTITNWYLAANLSGTIQFDIKRSGTSIVGAGNKPALSSAISGNAAASGWTSVTVTAGDILEWVVDASPAPATLTNCSVVLKVIK